MDRVQTYNVTTELDPVAAVNGAIALGQLRSAVGAGEASPRRHGIKTDDNSTELYPVTPIDDAVSIDIAFEAGGDRDSSVNKNRGP